MERLDSIDDRIGGLGGDTQTEHLAIATGNEDRHTVRNAPMAAALAKSSKGKNFHFHSQCESHI